MEEAINKNSWTVPTRATRAESLFVCLMRTILPTSPRTWMRRLAAKTAPELMVSENACFGTTTGWGGPPDEVPEVGTADREGHAAPSSYSRRLHLPDAKLRTGSGTKVDRRESILRVVDGDR